MNPTRLLDGELDDFERSLLSSASDDRGSVRARARALAVLGTLGVELTAASAAASTGTAGSLSGITSGAVAKWLVTGVVAGALSAGGVHAVQRVRANIAAPVEVAEAPRHVPKPAGDVTPPLAPLGRQEPARVPAPLVERSAVKPSEAPPEVAEALALPSSGGFPLDEPKSTLGLELAHLDRVRAALNRSDATSALAALSRYEHAFPHGALAREAALLTVEARLAKGDLAGARAVASRVLNVEGDGAYAKRMRALLEKGKSP